MADARDLMKVLDRRMRTTTNMENEKGELHEYLLMFQDEESGKIKYTEMAADLRGFNYDLETNEGVMPKSANSISSGRRSYFGALVQRNVFNDDLLVLDSQKVPANKLDAIERSLVRVNRHL
jgi:Ca2+-binding EF-hand superfamily protein